MEVAAGAITPLLGKLGELLASELSLKKNVRQDVVSLQKELRFMHAVLCKVAEVPCGQLDVQVQLWAAEVRELSYDMEDAVDAFMVDDRTERRPVPAAGSLMGRVRVFLNKTVGLLSQSRALHEIAAAIEATRGGVAKQVAELRQRYERLDLPGRGSAGARDDGAAIEPLQLMAMFREAKDLVGVDRASDELIAMLSDGPKDLKVVSIVGFGGLGKTTLAKAVYDKAKGQFDCGAFVSVSKNPQLTLIFKKMLSKLDKERFENINEAVRDAEQLICLLRGFLENRRYLIVLDDIWNERTYEYMKIAFPDNGLGSRLITTSRIVGVSEACCSSREDRIYTMKPLSDAASQRLFYARIFQADRCPRELEQVSRNILKKCGGIPLAIISIASLLSTRVKSKDDWNAVLSSIGRGLTDGSNPDEMQTILSPSYYDLPSHLKPCLLYLSTFPEDYEIRRSRLIWRWIAEGIIKGTNEGNLFEVGVRYFNELINRSLILPADIDIEGAAHACRVHDMVLRLHPFHIKTRKLRDGMGWWRFQ